MLSIPRKHKPRWYKILQAALWLGATVYMFVSILPTLKQILHSRDKFSAIKNATSGPPAKTLNPKLARRVEIPNADEPYFTRPTSDSDAAETLNEWKQRIEKALNDLSTAENLGHSLIACAVFDLSNT
jgi:hypothetical protein